MFLLTKYKHKTYLRHLFLSRMMRSPAKYLGRRCPIDITLHAQFNSTAFLKDDPKKIGQNPRTAAIIVIGDEILKGQVLDTNSHFASRTLYDMGVKVQRITVVGDHKEDIIQEIKFASPKFTYVITTGGIGPTHDDITFDAVANAFNQSLVPHPELVKICSEFFHTSDLNAPAMKLAHIPQSAKLTFGFDKTRGRRTLYPNVSVKNVYIFPGVPQLMERLFSAVSEKLFGGGESHFHLREIYVNAAENQIAESLNKVVCAHPDVVFGSYPKFFDHRYKVKLTVESENEEQTTKAFEALRDALPLGVIVDCEPTPLAGAYETLLKFVQASNGTHLQKTLQIVEECCKKHSPHQISLYFDGSNESSVVLHLYHACLRRQAKDAIICAFCVEDSTRSSELNNHIREAIVRYNVQSFEVLHCPLPAALDQYVSVHPEKAAVVVGSAAIADAWGRTAGQVTVLTPLEGWSDVDVARCLRALFVPHFNVHDTIKYTV